MILLIFNIDDNKNVHNHGNLNSEMDKDTDHNNYLLDYHNSGYLL